PDRRWRSAEVVHSALPGSDEVPSRRRFYPLSNILPVVGDRVATDLAHPCEDDPQRSPASGFGNDVDEEGHCGTDRGQQHHLHDEGGDEAERGTREIGATHSDADAASER